VEFRHGLGIDYVSCSPFRIPIARLAAAHAELRERQALGGRRSRRDSSNGKAGSRSRIRRPGTVRARGRRPVRARG
jgi:pyruvate,orthophosphate dikinase